MVYVCMMRISLIRFKVTGLMLVMDVIVYLRLRLMFILVGKWCDTLVKED